MYQLRGQKILPVVLPSMSKAENFSDHPRKLNKLSAQNAVLLTLKQMAEACIHFATVLTGMNEVISFNPLNAELNPICYLLALLGAHHFLHVSGIRVKSLALRLLMSYIYGAPILDVSRSHTMTHHIR